MARGWPTSFRLPLCALGEIEILIAGEVVFALVGVDGQRIEIFDALRRLRLCVPSSERSKSPLTKPSMIAAFYRSHNGGPIKTISLGCKEMLLKQGTTHKYPVIVRDAE